MDLHPFDWTIIAAQGCAKTVSWFGRLMLLHFDVPVSTVSHGLVFLPPLSLSNTNRSGHRARLEPWQQMVCRQIVTPSGPVESHFRHYRNESRCRRPLAVPTAKCRGRRHRRRLGEAEKRAVGTDKPSAQTHLCRRPPSA
jgi:hypothetical protein